MKVLPRAFYARNTLIVAKELLGKCLVRRVDEGEMVSKIVEVEAYRGSDDPASHAYRGESPRNRLMFGKAGIAYVYFIYGNHHCLNVTTEREGTPGAVLFRALEPVKGREIMQKNRGTRSLSNLTNGPGKLTQALNITKKQNGLDLTNEGELFIHDPGGKEFPEIVSAKRVGVKAGLDKLWRFYIKNNRFVSRK
jgi:DNA-3-methyladenine glycosylase